MFTFVVQLGFFVITFGIYRQQNTSDKIYALIREVARDMRTVKVSDVMDRCTTKGFKPDEVDRCIEEYEQLNIWQVNQTRTKITFI